MFQTKKPTKPPKNVGKTGGTNQNNYNNNNNNAYVPPAPSEPAPATPANNGMKPRGGSNKKPGHTVPNQDSSMISRPKLVFHCQQAQGSPTGIISGFTSIKELYAKIAECYDFPSEEILFCTLNTHKVDMGALLGGQIGLEDFIFAHRKGQHKEVQVEKTEDALGLTITDNGAGYCFIKKIREGSVIDKLTHIHVGDHIERIDSHNLVGRKHYEVAKLLKEIPKGTTFTMRLIEPLRDGFGYIDRKSQTGSTKRTINNGTATIRFAPNGVATVATAPDDNMQTAIDKINSQLETFMGIHDTELATELYELGSDKQNPLDFTDAIEASEEFGKFGFTEDFTFDVWGIVSDAKAGRL